MIDSRSPRRIRRHGEGGRDRARFEARSRREYVSPYEIAIGYLGLGEADRMFAWLDSSCAARDPFLAQGANSTLWDPVRADPRFPRLRERMGPPP